MCGKYLDYLCFLLFFFFKQKTAYEMRISDWISDVCSSDLAGAVLFDLLGIRCQHFVQHRLDGAGISDLLEALLLDDLVSRTFAGRHRLEDHLGDIDRKRVV